MIILMAVMVGYGRRRRSWWWKYVIHDGMPAVSELRTKHID
jgi:hypothetical protein